jgi:hypothetical protein
MMVATDADGFTGGGANGASLAANRATTRHQIACCSSPAAGAQPVLCVSSILPWALTIMVPYQGAVWQSIKFAALTL